MYGSRHLAKKWSPPKTFGGNVQDREVDKIELFVLLDLIGARNPLFYSFFENTDTMHARLVEIERHLSKAKLLRGRNFMFLEESGFAGKQMPKYLP